jgi:hypothetical protein
MEMEVEVRMDMDMDTIRRWGKEGEGDGEWVHLCGPRTA